MVALFHPRKEQWKEHFTWIDNFQKVKGTTPTGRVTVFTLKLNRAGVVNLRKLILLGKIHPPLDTLG